MARMGMLALIGLSLSVLAACADTPSGRSGGAESTSPSPSEQPMSQNPPPSALPTAPGGPSDQIKPVTVRGTVEAGRAPGCREFVTATTRFVLSGELSRDMRVGDQFEVTGLPAPQVRTTCDGVVMQLHRVRRL